MQVFFAAFFSFSSVYADSKVGGEHYNLDYFTATQNPQTKHLLDLVEAHHLDEDVWTNLRAGDFEPALASVLYTLRRFPNHPTALQLIGSIARLTNNQSIALFHYKKALSLFPQYAFTHAQYGKYLVELGKVNEGIAELKEAIKMDPKLAAAYAWLAKAYYKSGQSQLGRQADEQAKALGYKDSTVMEAHKNKLNW